MSSPAPASPGDRIDGRRLRRLNVVAAGLHAAQATAMVALSNDLALPVTAAYASVNGDSSAP